MPPTEGELYTRYVWVRCACACWDVGAISESWTRCGTGDAMRDRDRDRGALTGIQLYNSTAQNRRLCAGTGAAPVRARPGRRGDADAA